jgi:hypothetical protein
MASAVTRMLGFMERSPENASFSIDKEQYVGLYSD